MLFLLAQQLAGFGVNEMKPGAGGAGEGLVNVFGIIIIKHVCQPMMHVHASLRTPKKDGASHAPRYSTALILKLRMFTYF